jgi:hypothetical protein
MVQCLQAAIDASNRSKYHAVLLVAGSCKHGLTGLEARSIPLVLPRAKDCISLLLDHSLAQPQARQHARTSDSPRVEAGAERADNSAAPRKDHWMAPVLTPGLAGRRLPPARVQPWSWRDAFNPSPAPAKGKSPEPRLTLLEMLVTGYWNYTDFLVVAPGWRVVVEHNTGLIGAEEIIL